MKYKIIKNYIFILLFCDLVCEVYAIANELKKGIVYVYTKNGDISYYHVWTHKFYEKLFREYNVIPVATLIGLNNFEYIVTEEVPTDDVQLQCLSSYKKNKVLLFVPDNIGMRIEHFYRSYDKRYHESYSRVFTWNDDLIDNKKYFKLVPCCWWDDMPIKMQESLPNFEKRKLAVFVGEFFGNTFAKSNYLERIILIDFFERVGTNELDFYGYYWQKSVETFGYKNWKGGTDFGADRRLGKINVAKHYKFDFCYENTLGTNGWVSERIFDAFAAGCVPIYLGSDNIESYISGNCFINARNFKTYKQLYEFMKKVTEKEYLEYIRNIKEFLASERVQQLFSVPRCIQNIRKILEIDDMSF